jgi:hypothetical protein
MCLYIWHDTTVMQLLYLLFIILYCVVLYSYWQVLCSEPWGEFDESMKQDMYVMLCYLFIYPFDTNVYRIHPMYTIHYAMS